jgi:hypothetical protein
LHLVCLFCSLTGLSLRVTASQSSTVGATTWFNCPAGQYAATVRACVRAFSRLDRPRSTTRVGSHSGELCFLFQAGQPIGCVLCDPGSFSTGGAALCQSCNEGQFASLPGRTACSDWYSSSRPFTRVRSRNSHACFLFVTAWLERTLRTLARLSAISLQPGKRITSAGSLRARAVFAVSDLLACAAHTWGYPDATSLLTARPEPSLQRNVVPLSSVCCGQTLIQFVRSGGLTACLPCFAGTSTERDNDNGVLGFGDVGATACYQCALGRFAGPGQVHRLRLTPRPV